MDVRFMVDWRVLVGDCIFILEGASDIGTRVGGIVGATGFPVVGTGVGGAVGVTGASVAGTGVSGVIGAAGASVKVPTS